MNNDIRVTRSMAKLLRHLLNMYSVKQPVSYMTANSVAHVSSGTFYPNMERLRHEGWVTVEWASLPDGNNPPRLFFSLTVEGAALAKAALERHHPRPSFLDRLMGRKML